MSLGTDELASMRATAQSAMPDQCQVQRVTRASDGAGGFTETWVTVATLPCAIAPMRGRPEERAIAEQIKARVLWVLLVPAGSDVRTEDRLVVGTRTFEVHGTGERSYEITNDCICSEVQL